MRRTAYALVTMMFLASLLHAQGRGQASPASVPPPRSTTTQAYPAEQIAGRAAAVHRAVRLLSRPRRDGRRIRSRPDALGHRGRRRARRQAGATPSRRARRQGNAGVHVERRRSRCNRRVCPRPEDQGGVADRWTADRGRRRPADGRSRGGPQVFRRRLCEVPFAHRRSRRRRPRDCRASRCCSACSIPPGRDGSKATVTVTLASGEVVTGRLAYRDEFTIALTDANGWYRAWPAQTGEVRRQRSAAGPCRSTRQVHRWGHA